MHSSAHDRTQKRNGSSRWALPVAVAFAVTLAFRFAVPVAVHAPDTSFYRNLATGIPVQRPFAYRILAPHLAALLASSTRHPQDWGFRTLGTGCIFLFALCLVTPLLQARGLLIARLTLLTGVLATPVPAALWSNLYLPDLLHATLTALYLLLLRARYWTVAAGVLPFLFLARESSLLLAAVAVLVLARLARRRVAVLHGAASLAGWALSQRAGSYGLPNERGVGNGLYLLEKVPHNLLRNILGIHLWTERMDGPRPAFLWTLPSWLHPNHIQQVGFSYFTADAIGTTLLYLLTSFGAGLAVAFLLIERRALLWGTLRTHPWLLIAGVYGLLSFVLAPALGASMDRLLDYGWPLFLLALPLLFLQVVQSRLPATKVLILLLLHTGIAWLPDLLRYSRSYAPRMNALSLFLPALGVMACLATVADLLRPYLQERSSARKPSLPRKEPARQRMTE